MEYEKVIVDMLNRICALEQQVRELTAEKSNAAAKLGTADVKNYITSLKKQAAKNCKEFLELTANDIHSALKLKSRMPIVCNAMKQSMNKNDVITHQTASGYSSTLTVKYFLD